MGGGWSPVLPLPTPPPTNGDQTTGRFPSSFPYPFSSSRLLLASDYPPCPYKKHKAPSVTLKMNGSGEERGREEKGQNPPNFLKFIFFTVTDQLFASPCPPASLQPARLGGSTPALLPSAGVPPPVSGRGGLGHPVIPTPCSSPGASPRSREHCPLYSSKS